MKRNIVATAGLFVLTVSVQAPLSWGQAEFVADPSAILAVARENAAHAPDAPAGAAVKNDPQAGNPGESASINGGKIVLEGKSLPEQHRTPWGMVLSPAELNAPNWVALGAAALKKQFETLETLYPGYLFVEKDSSRPESTAYDVFNIRTKCLVVKSEERLWFKNVTAYTIYHLNKRLNIYPPYYATPVSDSDLKPKARILIFPDNRIQLQELSADQGAISSKTTCNANLSAPDVNGMMQAACEGRDGIFIERSWFQLAKDSNGTVTKAVYHYYHEGIDVGATATASCLAE